MNMKEIAWKFLLDNDIDDFRINLDEALDLVKRNGWRIFSYLEQPELLTALGVEEFAKNHEAFTIVHNGEYIIFYKDELSYNEKIFVIMHEVGHIVGKHTYNHCVVGHSSAMGEINLQEQEANLFACEVLAPSCILKRLHIESIEKLKKMKLLPEQYIPSFLIKILDSSDEQENDYEKKILKKYRTFIHTYQLRRWKHQLYKILGNRLFIMLVLILILLMVNERFF